MRYAIIADIHSNLEALSAVLKNIENESPDRILCVGDIVGYGADFHECITLVREKIDFAVAGNHDRACLGLYDISRLNAHARSAVLWTRRNLEQEDADFLKGLNCVISLEDIVMTHGSLQRPEEFNYIDDTFDADANFPLFRKRVCAVGHSHLPGIFAKKYGSAAVRLRSSGPITLEEGYSYIINSGSVGQPRDGNPRASYAMYDTRQKTLSIKRVSYNTSAAARKIVAAGLHPFLAERIKKGN